MTSFFVWVRDTGPWSPPRLVPQIIHDAGVADYLVKEDRLHIVARYELPEHEAGMTITQLMAKYPAPSIVLK